MPFTDPFRHRSIFSKLYKIMNSRSVGRSHTDEKLRMQNVKMVRSEM